MNLVRLDILAKQSNQIGFVNKFSRSESMETSTDPIVDMSINNKLIINESYASRIWIILSIFVKIWTEVG